MSGAVVIVPWHPEVSITMANLERQRPRLTIFICNPEESLEAQLVHDCIEERRQAEYEEDLKVEQALEDAKPLIVDVERVPCWVFADYDAARSTTESLKSHIAHPTHFL